MIVSTSSLKLEVKGAKLLLAILQKDDRRAVNDTHEQHDYQYKYKHCSHSNVPSTGSFLKVSSYVTSDRSIDCAFPAFSNF